MTNPIKLGLYVVFIVIAAVVAINIIKGLLGLILPLAIVAGIGLILYGLINRKSLGGNGPSLR